MAQYVETVAGVSPSAAPRRAAQDKDQKSANVNTSLCLVVVYRARRLTGDVS
jgi:hypothetical protein